MYTKVGVMETQLNENEFLCADVEPGEMVLVKEHCFGGGECWGYVQYYGLHEFGISVRLELGDDHPTMAEAIRDTGMDGDQVELIDTVPFECLGRRPGRDGWEMRPVRVWKRSVTDKERSARAHRRGFERLSLPELEAHYAAKREASRR